MSNHTPSALDVSRALALEVHSFGLDAREKYETLFSAESVSALVAAAAAAATTPIGTDGAIEAVKAFDEVRGRVLEELDRVFLPVGGEIPPEFGLLWQLGLPVHSNITASDDGFVIPGGFHLAVIPESITVKKADGKGQRQSVAIHIVALPGFDVVVADAVGNAFVRSTLLGAFANKYLAAQKGTANSPGVTLTTLADFVVSRRGGGEDELSIKPFRKIAKTIIGQLAAKHAAFAALTPDALQGILASKAFAETYFPNVQQTVWVKVLDAAVRLAESQNIGTGIFSHWKATRDVAAQAVSESIADIDF